MAETRENKTLEGIILRAYPSGDADLVVRILTRDEGKVAAIAKHVRKSAKRFSGTLDLFDSGRFEIRTSRAALPVILGFNPISSFATLRNSLDKIAAASLLCETIDYLSLEESGHDESEQYDSLVAGLRALEAASTRAEILAATYEFGAQLVAQAGFLDPAQLGTGSTKRLNALLNQIEQCVEKKLASRPALQEVIDSFRRDASG